MCGQAASDDHKEQRGPDYLAKTEREKLVVYIRKEPVVYEWKGGKYNDVSLK